MGRPVALFHINHLQTCPLENPPSVGPKDLLTLFARIENRLIDNLADLLWLLSLVPSYFPCFSCGPSPSLPLCIPPPLRPNYPHLIPFTLKNLYHF